MSAGGWPNCQGWGVLVVVTVLPQVSTILTGSGLLKAAGWVPTISCKAVAGLFVQICRSAGRAVNAAANSCAVVSGDRGPVLVWSPVWGMMGASAAAVGFACSDAAAVAVGCVLP